MKKKVFIVVFLIFFTGIFCSAGENHIEVKVLTKTGLSWNGAPLPLYKNAKPEITVLKITIPPGTSLPMHQHPVINVGYMISGELTVYCEDGKVLHLKEGDSIVEVVDTWHYGKNQGDQPAVIVVVYAGYEGVPITIYKK
ncbi:MAG TPA: cupin domain-containing protein [Syntrophorhabdaceae bacterium]|nr:cupin domain-containing protein [Syntrophorhabdaceae bacterium]